MFFVDDLFVALQTLSSFGVLDAVEFVLVRNAYDVILTIAIAIRMYISCIYCSYDTCNMCCLRVWMMSRSEQLP